MYHQNFFHILSFFFANISYACLKQPYLLILVEASVCYLKLMLIWYRDGNGTGCCYGTGYCVPRPTQVAEEASQALGPRKSNRPRVQNSCVTGPEWKTA
jgi:hypothetical protein